MFISLLVMVRIVMQLQFHPLISSQTCAVVPKLFDLFVLLNIKGLDTLWNLRELNLADNAIERVGMLMNGIP